MATPSPAESKAEGAVPPPPPATVGRRDPREEFIPPSSLSGRYEFAPSISSIGTSAGPLALRLEGAETAHGSHRTKTLSEGSAADILLLAGIVLSVLGYLVWRHFQRETQDNFASQDHNKD